MKPTTLVRVALGLACAIWAIDFVAAVRVYGEDPCGVNIVDDANTCDKGDTYFCPVGCTANFSDGIDYSGTSLKVESGTGTYTVGNTNDVDCECDVTISENFDEKFTCIEGWCEETGNRADECPYYTTSYGSWTQETTIGNYSICTSY